MRETARVSAAAVWGTIVLCICLGIFTIFSLGLQAKLMPWWFAVQRQTVEESKSFIDSNTTSMINKIAEYAKTDNADQKQAIYILVCTQATKMALGTVPPNIAVWLAKHGECLGTNVGQ